MSEGIERAIGRVEGQLLTLTSMVTTDIADRKARDVIVDKKFEDQDERTRKVENRQYYFMGGGAVIGAILGFIGNVAL